MDTLRKNEDFLKRLLARRPHDKDRYLSRLATAELTATESTAGNLESFVEGDDRIRAGVLEAIISEERPVLFARATALDTTDVMVAGPEAQELMAKLAAASPRVLPMLPLIGRIDVENFTQSWLATGWFVDEDIVVTNRHVAAAIAEWDGRQFAFRSGAGARIQGALSNGHFVDDEFAAGDSFAMTEVLYIEPGSGPNDIALVRVKRPKGDGNAPRFIPVAATDVSMNHLVCVAGYPASAPRRIIPDQDLMRRLYRDKYNVKRVAPGYTVKTREGVTEHDCTTLGGNSGSVMLDLETGDAVGLHYAGVFLDANFAVPASTVRKYLDGGWRGRIPEVSTAGPAPLQAAPPAPAPRAAPAPAPPPVITPTGGSVSLTIPLHITVSLGVPAATAPTAPIVPRTPRVPAPAERAEDPSSFEESAAEDLAGREGYSPTFLGKRFEVPLPTVIKNVRDVLEYVLAGETEKRRILDYTHFSVLMSKKRRMCRYSACNIDGGLSRKSNRGGWKFDPRIDAGAQIKDECYGNPPKFSRGHMTRREDPAWGDADTAARGNSDSMHVTNTTPQMQAFNSPIWLALEDYALQNARQDDMKISVLTGPYLDDRKDPTYYGVQVPTSFWKIIVFVHEKTKKLTATGYEMSQVGTLPPQEEFVFGNFISPQLNIATQVSIRSIQQKSGLDFGSLAESDPFDGNEESVGSGEMDGALLAMSQIRFY